MSDKNPVTNESNAAAVDGASKSPKTRIRGNALDGAEQKDAVDHTDYERSRNPDTELRLDGEDDSLYSDGLDIGDNTDTLAGTDGNSPKGIKGGVP
jgi:hypothetical protein